MDHMSRSRNKARSPSSAVIPTSFRLPAAQGRLVVFDIGGLVNGDDALCMLHCQPRSRVGSGETLSS